MRGWWPPKRQLKPQERQEKEEGKGEEEGAGFTPPQQSKEFGKLSRNIGEKESFRISPPLGFELLGIMNANYVWQALCLTVWI